MSSFISLLRETVLADLSCIAYYYYYYYSDLELSQSFRDALRTTIARSLDRSLARLRASSSSAAMTATQTTLLLCGAAGSGRSVYDAGKKLNIATSVFFVFC